MAQPVLRRAISFGNESEQQLPVQFQCELELARVVSRRRLARKATCAHRWIAQLVHGGNVGAVQHVESIGDEVNAQPLAQRNSLRQAHINLEEVWSGERISSEVTYAARGR